MPDEISEYTILTSLAEVRTTVSTPQPHLDLSENQSWVWRVAQRLKSGFSKTNAHKTRIFKKRKEKESLCYLLRTQVGAPQARICSPQHEEETGIPLWCQRYLQKAWEGMEIKFHPGTAGMAELVKHLLN